MKFEEEIRQRAGNINTIIEKYLPEEKGYQKTVLQAMNYAVNGGGKRIRPMLMAECAQLFGGARAEILEPYMAAIEMIHTYSLIHDDLPALDDDDYRRGRKTTHIVYGEAMGILAGDGLLNYAYEVATFAFSHATGEEMPKTIEAMKILAHKPGIYGMIGGQTVDVEKTGQSLKKDELEYIYQNKTGAMIEAAMMIGAVLAGADADQEERIEQAAADIGMAFQIQDDILDVVGNPQELGKPVGSDEKNHKTTYVTFKGLEQSKADVKELSMEAIEILEEFELSLKNPFLKELILWMMQRNK